MFSVKPPVEPTKDDCCDSGCNPCIFDVYDYQLKLYAKYHNKQDAIANNCYQITDYGISQLEYTKFYLIDIVQISTTQKYLFFQKLKNHDQSQQVWWKPGDHFLIKYTSASASCTRAFTPIKIKLNGKDINYDFLIVVKKYSNGLVSNYLFNMNLGEETVWRGPYGSYNIQPNQYRSIVMIAQGTGVAPFISIIQNIICNEEDMTRIVLFYCCKSISEILFRNELYEFNSYWNFSYKVFLSDSHNEISVDKKYNEPIVDGKLNITKLEILKLQSNNQYLLCGSSQFMRDYEALLKNANYSDNIILF